MKRKEKTVIYKDFVFTFFLLERNEGQNNLGYLTFTKENEEMRCFIRHFSVENVDRLQRITIVTSF